MMVPGWRGAPGLGRGRQPLSSEYMYGRRSTQYAEADNLMGGEPAGCGTKIGPPGVGWTLGSRVTCTGALGVTTCRRVSCASEAAGGAGAGAARHTQGAYSGMSARKHG